VKTVRDIQTLRGMTQSWHQDGDSIALVPTMGSLHPGHISLVRLAHEYAERVIVSVFVNPTQFGPNEDYKSYPRSLDNDRRRVSRAGVDVLFAPGNEEIYPFGEDAMTRVSVPDLSTVLCGDSRPGHFDGVTSVVSRLFNIIQPDVAVFGQKDYQQLVIIRRMVADLHLPIKILAGQTQRQDDGLALSSRNRYLSDTERSVAPQLHGTLRRCGDQIMSGNRNFASLEAEARAQLEASGFEVDYFTVRKAGDLSSPDSDSRYLVILAAARLGEARLIDNILIEAQEQMRSTGT
jgi:pantoate--beta-alanine ligase